MNKMKKIDDLTSLPSKIIRTELHRFADKLIGSGDVRSIQRLANESTIVESRYLFYGFDNEIRL